MTRNAVLMAVAAIGALCGVMLAAVSAINIANGVTLPLSLLLLAWGVVFAISNARSFGEELRAVRAKRSGERPPIVLARPDASWVSLDFEGGAFDDPDDTGWQVVPYSTTRAWPCDIRQANAVLFRGAPGVISFAEARRMAAALVATADHAETAQKGGRS